MSWDGSSEVLEFVSNRMFSSRYEKEKQKKGISILPDISVLVAGY